MMTLLLKVKGLVIFKHDIVLNDTTGTGPYPLCFTEIRLANNQQNIKLRVVFLNVFYTPNYGTHDNYPFQFSQGARQHLTLLKPIVHPIYQTTRCYNSTAKNNSYAKFSSMGDNTFNIFLSPELTDLLANACKFDVF